MKLKLFLRFGILAALLTIVPALLAYAAPPAPGVGVVDMEAIEGQYVGFAQARTTWGAFQETRQNTYKELIAGQYLTPADFAELQRFAQQKVKTDQARFDALTELGKKNAGEFNALMEKVKTNLGEADQARLEELKKGQMTPDTAKELDDLLARGKVKLADEDKARLMAMENDHEKVMDIISGVGDEYRTEIDTERERLLGLLNEHMQGAIGKMAKDQNLIVVLNRNVVSQQGSQQLVLWGGTDITKNVTKYLNDTFKPESLTAPAPKPAK